MTHPGLQEGALVDGFVIGARVHVGAMSVLYRVTRVEQARPLVMKLPRVGSGVILELSSPLAGASPLQFDPAKPGPYFGVSYEKRDASWITRVAGLRSTVAVTDDGREFVAAGSGQLVVDKEGTIVSIDGYRTLDRTLEGLVGKS